MGRKRGGERYLGPYAVGDGRWRVVYVPAGGTYKADGVSFTFATESAAKAKLAEGRRELRDEGLTVGALVPIPTVVALNRFDPADTLHVANRDWLAGRDGFDVVTDPAALAARWA